MKNFRHFSIFLKSLISFSPSNFFLAVSLLLLNALLSGAGLLMLIPLLRYAGWLTQTTLPTNLSDSWQNILPVQQERWPLVIILGIFVGLMALLAGAEYWRTQVLARLRLNYLFQLQQDLNSKIAGASWTYLLSRKRQHAHYMITSGLNQLGLLAYTTLQVVTEAILIIGYICLSALISFKLTLFSIAIAGSVLFLTRRNQALSNGREQFLVKRNIQDELAKFLDGLKLAKSYNLIEQYTLHFDQLIEKSQTQQLNFSQNQSVVQCVFRISTAIIFSIILFLAITYFQVSMVTMLALLLVLSRLLPRFSSLQQNYLLALNYAPVFSEAQALLTDFSSQQETYTIKKNLEFKREIRCESISYSYHGSDVLSQISCCIPKNTTTAIVGKSGAGKSTLADILLGLLKPIGKLYIDDTALEAENLYAWRDKVSYVPQDTYLFHDSIKANLLWANNTATESELWQALKMASLDSVIKKMPQQLETLIGDRGIQLSGGERQRLALARALLRKPQVLLLDEATSALDAQNEELIYQTLRALHGKMTIILIAHRFSTIRAADQVLVLEQGKLIETNQVNSLLEDSSSHFAALFQQQI